MVIQVMLLFVVFAQGLLISSPNDQRVLVSQSEDIFTEYGCSTVAVKKKVSVSSCTLNLKSYKNGLGGFCFVDRNTMWVDKGCRASFQLTDPQQEISCSSVGYKYATCKLTKPLEKFCACSTIAVKAKESVSSCTLNLVSSKNGEGGFGFLDEDTMWVDKGCRATFQLTDPPQEISCSSHNYKYATCNLTKSLEKFCSCSTITEEVKQSTSSCKLNVKSGQNGLGGFGFVDKNTMWVDQGCRSSFRLSDPQQEISCSSHNYKYATCKLTKPLEKFCGCSTIAVKSKLSVSSCTLNLKSGTNGKGGFGFTDKNTMWVDKGCRASFQLTNPKQEVSCSSVGYKYASCKLKEELSSCFFSTK